MFTSWSIVRQDSWNSIFITSCSWRKILWVEVTRYRKFSVFYQMFEITQFIKHATSNASQNHNSLQDLAKANENWTYNYLFFIITSKCVEENFQWVKCKIINLVNDLEGNNLPVSGLTGDTSRWVREICKTSSLLLNSEKLNFFLKLKILFYIKI